MPEKIGLEAVFATAEFERGMQRYLDAMEKATQRTESAAGTMTATGAAMGGGLTAGAMAAATAVGHVLADAFEWVAARARDALVGLMDFGREAIGITARVAELNVVMETIGRNAGQDVDDLHDLVERIKELGITTDVAQGLVINFSRWQLDMAQATDLARLAQDAAVISMQDSSEALDGLMHGITTLNTRVLRTYGITLPSVIDAQEEYAETLGITRDEMTETQLIQAVLNAVLDQGTQIAGAYEAAMTQPGKRLRSMRRYTQELQEEMAGPFMGAFGNVVDILQAFVKGMTGAVGEGGALRPILEAIGQVAETVLGGALEFLTELFDELFVQGRLNEPIQRLLDGFGRLATAVGDLGAALGLTLPEGADFADVIVAIVDAVADAVDRVADFVGSLAGRGEGIRGFFDRLAEGAEGPLRTLGDVLREVMPRVQAFVQDALERIGEWWEVHGPTVIDAMLRLQEVSATVFMWLAEQLPYIWGIIEGPLGGMLDLILGLVGAIASAIMGDWSGAWASLAEGASGMWEGIKAGWRGFLDWVSSWFGTSWLEIKLQWGENWEAFVLIVSTVWDNVIEALGEGLANAIAAIRNSLGEWFTIGADLVAGVVRGITSTAGRIADAVLHALAEAWDSATAWLLGGSPSVRFSWMGEDMMAGLAMGVMNAMDLPTAAVEMAVTHSIAPVQAAVASVAGPTSVGGTSVQNTTNINMDFDANYARTQSPATVRDDITAILALARR